MALAAIVGITVLVVLALMGTAGYLIEKNAEEEGGATKTGPG
jgi:hypothetical protein